jgi:hypothetical protein
VYNNTVCRQDLKGRGIRCIEKINNVDIANNLVRGALILNGGETTRNNLVGPLEGVLVDPANGNHRLADQATAAIDQGTVLDEIADDIDGRQRDMRPDIGASEYFRP